MAADPAKAASMDAMSIQTLDRRSDHEEGPESATSPTASESSESSQESAETIQKTAEIIAACRSRDVSRLRSLADAQGGFLTDTLRRAAWPILLGQQPSPDGTLASVETEKPVASELKSEESNGDWRQLPRHRDEEQVKLDVNRSFIYYPSDQSDAELEQRKADLGSLIFQVLRRYPYLCYFQGFHDICQVFLLVLGSPDLAAKVVARLSVLRIRDFMLPNLGPTTSQLRLLPDILAAADPELRRHLAGLEPFYALAGTLTMYAHNIEGYHDIARLFDVFLAREPVFSIYMFAQIVISRRDEIFEFDEPDMLHVILGKVPAKMDLETLLQKSAALFDRYPPDILPSWRRISRASVLKTARDVEACSKQTMAQGHEFFEQQAKELRWADLQDKIKMTMWMYRRPARAIGMAVAVAAVAFYLRRNPGLVHAIMALLSR